MKPVKNLSSFLDNILVAYSSQFIETQRKARLLVITCLIVGTLNVILAGVMIATAAWVVSIMIIVFFIICVATVVLVKGGKFRVASNFFLITLFVIMFLAIKFDEYQDSYETYVFATLGLTLLIIASLVGYTRYQLLGCLILNVVAILVIYFVDIRPLTVAPILLVQNLVTSLLMVIVGSCTGIILISVQKKLLWTVESERKELDRMLRITEVYTRRSLVDIITDGGDPTRFIPEAKSIAVLFCDIRQFTDLAEAMKPIDIVRFLNSYFDRMNIVIQRHSGEIDKLIGDCIMASFASPIDAIDAARDMGTTLQEYNRERCSYDHAPIHVGIGVSFGQVVQGNIGSREKMDYTVIGDVVNASSRLEALTRHYNIDTIISEEVAEAAGQQHELRMLDVVLVKGRLSPIRIYELYRQDPDWVKEIKRANQMEMDRAFELYKDGAVEEACVIYDKLIDRVGAHRYLEQFCADPVLDFYRDRCINLKEQFDAGFLTRGEWDGIHVFHEK